MKDRDSDYVQAYLKYMVNVAVLLGATREFATSEMNAVLEFTDSGELIRKAGIMGVVVAGGRINSGDSISVKLPAGPHEKLQRV